MTFKTGMTYDFRIKIVFMNADDVMTFKTGMTYDFRIKIVFMNAVIIES